MNCLHCSLSDTTPVLGFSISSCYALPCVELNILFIQYCSFLDLYHINLCAMAVILRLNAQRLVLAASIADEDTVES